MHSLFVQHFERQETGTKCGHEITVLSSSLWKGKGVCIQLFGRICSKYILVVVTNGVSGPVGKLGMSGR